MRKEGARDALKKRVASMTEERVAQLVAWMRSKRTGRFRRKQTPLQEFKGNLESMTNREVEEMLEGTPRRDFQKIGQISRQTQCMHSFSAGRVYETHGCRYCRERA